MRKVVEGLKPIKIMKDEDIRILREYIRKKYPAFDSKERARVLADAVHKQIDRHLEGLEEGERAPIRRHLLRRAVTEERFELCGDDVLGAALQLDRPDEWFYASLANWVNERLPDGVEAERIREFFEAARPHREVLAQKGMAGLLDCVEEADRVKRVPLPEPPIAAEGEKGPQEDDVVPEPLPAAGGGEADLDSPWDVMEGVALREEESARRESPGKVVELRPRERRKKRAKLSLMPPLAAASLILMAAIWFSPVHIAVSLFTAEADGGEGATLVEYAGIDNPLPDHLKYRPINVDKLREWLNNRNSLLADEPYLSAILQAGRDFNIDPLLLIAITGQEQKFVPRTDKDALKIANNPFNVFHSWQEYNTNIHEASRIAARTVVNLSEGRPSSVDPIAWINRKYAEDKKWWVGVSKLHRQLTAEVGE